LSDRGKSAANPDGFASILTMGRRKYDRLNRVHICLFCPIKEVAMKVVVLDHPKILSFFLRRIYGIKRVKDKQV